MTGNIRRPCPTCTKALTPRTHRGIELDVCQYGCHGIWLDYGELAKLSQSDTFETLDAAFEGSFVKAPLQQALEGDPFRCCPMDNTEMERYEWNVGTGVVMDSCPKCNGIWLDAGEMEGMVAYVQRVHNEFAQIPAEIKAKMAQIHGAAMRKDAEIEDEVTREIIDWDLWVLDDILRWLIKAVIPDAE